VRRFLTIAAVSALVLTAAGSAADSFTLTIVAQTNSTITFSYPQQSGYGYLYSANGQLVSRTNDPTRTTVRFSKASSYQVAAIAKGTIGSYPVAPPPPPPPVCSDLADNDGDGKVDLDDPGCTGPTDTDETDPTPPAGNTLVFSGTVTAASFVAQVQAAPAGPLTVRPAAGQTSFTVAGTFENGSNCIAQKGDASGLAAQCLHFNRTNVTVQHAVFQQILWFTHTNDGLTIEDSSIVGFNVQNGMDDWTFQRDTIDPACQYDNNVIYNSRNWKILNSTLQNIHYCPNESIHSEALYIGRSNDGFVISGNYFNDNGTTGHIFFTYFSAGATDSSSYPKNGCVTGNRFYKSHNKYHEIDVRAELQNVKTIHVDSTNVNLDSGKVLFAQPSWTSWLTGCQ
jgi:hypothetical protein